MSNCEKCGNDLMLYELIWNTGYICDECEKVKENFK